MKSPIARGLRAASRLAEWAHRRIHGPQYAPGDVVEVRNCDGECVLDEKTPDGEMWWCSGGRRCIGEGEITRVVRYGEE